MPSGSGWKNFTSAALPSDDVNGYLMSQAVMVFASSATRSAILVAPTEGMVTYLKDTDVTQYYSGSAWSNIGGGGVPVGVVNPFAGSAAPTDWALCYGQAVSRTTYASLFALISTTYGVGDGSTTFNLPDLRGRTVAGIDNMGGTDAGRIDIANSSGTVVGTQYVTLTSAQSGVPAHSHPNTASFSGSFTGTGASHGHVQDAHNHGISVARNNANTYLDTGNRWAGGVAANQYSGYAGSYNDITIYESYVVSNTATNQTTSLTPAGSVAGTVTVSNVDNTAANASSAHDNMQPTMVLNYIIKVQ